jgi:threonine dehydrogenase-like Zn-dependent dehydrogenase
VASSGVCGSDLHLVDMWPLEATLGHEFAGRLSDGRAVAIEPIVACRQCGPCLAGEYNRCAKGTGVLGVSHDGGMAERCIVPIEAIVPLPAGISLSDACLVEPIAVAVHAVRRVGVRPGDRVAIIGGGAIGQCAIVAAQAAGASVVDLVARHDRQREAAARLGAGDGAPDRIEAGTYDVVIEAAGTAESLARAAELARSGGRISLVATYWDSTVEMPGMSLCMKEITLVPAAMYGRSNLTRDVDIAASILALRPELGAAVITHRFPLDAATEAFATARDRAAGAIKVVLEV